MKRVNIGAMVAAALASGVAWAQGPVTASAPVFGMLEMVNGDRLQIAIEGFDGSVGLLRVRHPFAQEAFDLQISALTRFTVQAAQGEAVTAVGDWNVLLTNGDQIRGEAITLDADRLQMRNALIGMVSTPRSAVAGLNRARSSKTLYAGPQKDEEWIRNRATVKLTENRATVPQGEPFGIKLSALPRKARIDLNLRWVFPNFFIALYAKNAANIWDGNANSYQVVYQMGNQVLLNRMTPGVGMQQLGTANIRSAPPRGGALSFFFDLDNGRVAMASGNQIVAEWKDPNPPQNLGTHIVFLSHQGGMDILKLQVSEWDGRLPGATAPRPAGDADSITLKNGDNLSGTLVKIAPPSATVRSPFGDLAIPLDNIESVEFKSVAPEKSGDAARLTLKDGSSVTVAFRKIEKGVLFGDSPSLGSIRIPLESLRQAVWPNASAVQKGDEEQIAPAGSSSVWGTRMRAGVGVNVIIQDAGE